MYLNGGEKVAVRKKSGLLITFDVFKFLKSVMADWVIEGLLITFDVFK